MAVSLHRLVFDDMKTSKIDLCRLLPLFLVAVAGTAGRSETDAEELRHNFQNGWANQPLLMMTGPAAEGSLIADAKGLRIKLSESRPVLDPVGLRTRFGLRGDFDVVATCEILNADEPPKGFGAGARLFLRLDSATRDLVSLSRVRRSKEGDAFLAYHVHTAANGRQPQDFRILKAASPNGRLRVVRTGSTLSFQVADNQDEFQELHTVDVGAGDVTEFSLTATTGGQPGGIDLRWHDLTVTADQLPSTVIVAANTWSIWWAGAIVGIIILGASGAAIVRYRLSSASE